MPDELRKHYLSDGEGGQYSTNLDRNRYGNDDQYLFTGGPGPSNTAQPAAAAVAEAAVAGGSGGSSGAGDSIKTCMVGRPCQMQLAAAL